MAIRILCECFGKSKKNNGIGNDRLGSTSQRYEIARRTIENTIESQEYV
jgi:hypothetical protein